MEETLGGVFPLHHPLSPSLSLRMSSPMYSGPTLTLPPKHADPFIINGGASDLSLPPNFGKQCLGNGSVIK